jgi:hypothetical protein
MLLLLLPVAWLAVVIVVIAVCQAAARSDARHAPVGEHAPEVVREGLVVWDRGEARAPRAGAASSSLGAGRLRRRAHSSARRRRAPTH